VAHDALGDTSEQGALYTTPSVAADHDQISGPVLCSIDDLGKRATDLDEIQRGRLLRQAFTKVVDQLSRLFLGRGDEDGGLNAGVGGVYALGVDDMNERHLRPREARQLGTDISRMRRDGLVVDSNENLFEEHDSLPEPWRRA
jgi:hypothetical protein